MKDLCAMLKQNSYPGRGIVLGVNSAGESCAYYFIMGRSANSRNRVFVETEDGIRTQAHDTSKLEDPSLIIYHPVRRLGSSLIVTNGDQTDTICEMGDFFAGCNAREYEPDAPNYTPRISAILREDGSFVMSILKAEVECAKKASGASDATDADKNVPSESKQPRCIREFFCYEGCAPGSARFLSTYKSDGCPLPTFSGEPMCVDMPSADDVWQSLNAENKVSLYARVGDKVQIFNKNLGD